jgi:hypothetical protein
MGFSVQIEKSQNIIYFYLIEVVYILSVVVLQEG